jgi:hypothetical protein
MISPQESKYYPEDTSRVGRLKREAGVIPIKESKVSGSGRMTVQEYEDRLIADSKHHGLGLPPQRVLHELHQRVDLDHSLINAKSYKERLARAAVVFDHQFNTHEAEQVARQVTSERQAEAVYRRIRDRLFRDLNAWDRRIMAAEDAAIEAQP